MTTRIDLTQIGKRYNWTDRQRRYVDVGRRREQAEIWAVRDVSFAVADGEMVGIIGMNGSGKSTLLRLIAGLTTATTGYLRVDGSVHGLLELGSGMNSLLTGEENAVSDLMMSGLPKKASVERLDEIANFAELENHIDQPLRTYSQGMKLRLAFATATAIVPDILLVDELLAVGDGHFQEKCVTRLEQMREAGCTILLTSHDVDHVTRLCDRAVWMVDGRAKEVGQSSVVAGHYQGLLQAANMGGDDDAAGVTSGVVHLHSVQLQHPGGTPAVSLRVGAPLEIRVDYEVLESLPGAILEVSIHPEGSANPVLEVNTESDGERVRWEVGKGCLILHLDRVDLVSNAYSVHVGVFSTDWSTTWAYRWEAASFQVRGPDSRGALSPPRRWRNGE